jgi:hypothetical protein
MFGISPNLRSLIIDAITVVFSPRPRLGDSFYRFFPGAAIQTIVKLMCYHSNIRTI